VIFKEMALYQYLTLLNYLPAALYVTGVIDTLAMYTVISQRVCGLHSCSVG